MNRFVLNGSGFGSDFRGQVNCYLRNGQESVRIEQ